jgi:hypothetical protein
VGDLNRDGLLDLFIPDLSYCSLLIQRPDGKGFDYKTNKSGLAVTMGQYAGWAAMMFDYDHDGWLDIFTTHGNAHHEYAQENTIVRIRATGRSRIFRSVLERTSRKSTLGAAAREWTSTTTARWTWWSSMSTRTPSC